MTEPKKRGTKTPLDPQRAAEYGALGGRPQKDSCKEVRVRAGGRAIVQERTPDGAMPLQPGHVTHVRSGEITISLDDGRVIKVFYENPTDR